MKKIFLLCLVMAIVAYGCKKEDKTPPTAPQVTTSALSNVTTTSATSGGTITSNGNSAITISGIVFSKTNNTPTLSDSVISGTTTSGSFTVNLTNLDFGTTYYVRAYATNSVGTGYGTVVTLNTTSDTTKVRFTYGGATVTYGIITSSVTGKKWMDRNLGAAQVAMSLTDTLAYGDLFQWGRLADGHQNRYSGKVTTLSSIDVPGHNNFIVPTANPDLDWRSPKNDNLWQGSNGINNPCPAGWHVPTQSEWLAETNMTDPNSSFNQLKLVLAGYRSRLSGNLVNLGSQSNYWASTPLSTGSIAYFIESPPPRTAISDRGIGGSVRCIKN